MLLGFLIAAIRVAFRTEALPGTTGCNARGFIHFQSAASFRVQSIADQWICFTARALAAHRTRRASHRRAISRHITLGIDRASLADGSGRAGECLQIAHAGQVALRIRGASLK